MEEAKYFLQSQGELALGPFTLSELAGKGLMNSTLLYSTDRGEWIPVGRIPEVAALVSAESQASASEDVIDLGLMENPSSVDQRLTEEESHFEDASIDGQDEAEQVPWEVEEGQSWFKHYATCWLRYSEFSGRSSRKQYWSFFLFNTSAQFVFGAVDGWSGTFNFDAGYGLFSGLYNLVALIPALAVAVRRMHDVGRSGWVLLLTVVPVVNLLLIYWALKAGEDGANEWGPCPAD